MKLSRHDIRDATRRARRVVFPQREASTPESLVAWGDAAALWSDLFAPFQPLTTDAEVLEIGCGDGRLLGGLAEGGEVRRLVGVDRAAYWDGRGRGVPWRHQRFAGLLTMHDSLDALDALDDGVFDLVLCRELDSAFTLDQLNAGLFRLYRLIKEGGEAIVRVRCADPSAPRLDGPGYGFMTASAWIHQLQRAGFEIESSRRLWRDGDEASASRDLETEELHLHLLRPWEPDEMEALVV